MTAKIRLEGSPICQGAFCSRHSALRDLAPLMRSSSDHEGSSAETIASAMKCPYRSSDHPRRMTSSS